MTERPYFVKDDNPTLDQCITLAEWVVLMIEGGRTQEVEFQKALRFYGRPKFEEIWKAHQAKKKVAAEEKAQ